MIFLIGRILVRKLTRIFETAGALNRMDSTLRSFLGNLISLLLYLILGITIIGILGVPLASVITVLASAGIAVGLALQGALGNLAGGLMLLLNRPFNVGDYISTAGTEGIVRSIRLFYTVLVTLDNRRIMIPNGVLMNSNVVNFSAEPRRRVDLVFQCGRGEESRRLKELLREECMKEEKVLKEPEPFFGLTDLDLYSMEFSARVWVRNSDFRAVHDSLIERITDRMTEEGVSQPSVRVMASSDGQGSISC